MELAIISDTHIPSRAAELQPWVRERVGAADHTIHAGDVDSVETLEMLRELAGGDITVVRGNADILDLPETASVRLGGVEFVVHHGTGKLVNYHGRVARTVREYEKREADRSEKRRADGAGTESSADRRRTLVGVCGHTHQHMDDIVRGMRLLNPGSATGASPADEATMMTARVGNGDLDVTLHRG